MVEGKGVACSKEGEMGNVNTLSSVQGPVDPGTVTCTRHAKYVKKSKIKRGKEDPKELKEGGLRKPAQAY